VGFYNPYNVMVSELKYIRSESAASNLPIMPWISDQSWPLQSTGNNFTYYTEQMFQAALSGANGFLGWKYSLSPDPTNTAIVEFQAGELVVGGPIDLGGITPGTETTGALITTGSLWPSVTAAGGCGNSSAESLQSARCPLRSTVTGGAFDVQTQLVRVSMGPQPADAPPSSNPPTPPALTPKQTVNGGVPPSTVARIGVVAFGFGTGLTNTLLITRASREDTVSGIVVDTLASTASRSVTRTSTGPTALPGAAYSRVQAWVAERDAHPVEESVPNAWLPTSSKLIR
jgi:hypothetical protein